MKSYHPALASWITLLLVGAWIVVERYEHFPEWLHLANIPILPMALAIVIVGGILVSFLWGIVGIMSDKNRQDARIALTLSGFWIIAVVMFLVFAS